MKGDNRILLSELLEKLYNFSVGKNIVYTLTECLLDQAFESIVENNEESYLNGGFIKTETTQA